MKLTCMHRLEIKRMILLNHTIILIGRWVRSLSDPFLKQHAWRCLSQLACQRPCTFHPWLRYGKQEPVLIHLLEVKQDKWPGQSLQACTVKEKKKREECVICSFTSFKMLPVFSFFQLRQSVFQFCQKELAPKAQEIDKTNTFADMKVIFEIYISCWFCVILVQVVDVSER